MPGIDLDHFQNAFEIADHPVDHVLAHHQRITLLFGERPQKFISQHVKIAFEHRQRRSHLVRSNNHKIDFHLIELLQRLGHILLVLIEPFQLAQ